MSAINNNSIQGDSKEFLKIFNQLCYSRSAWEVWADVITVMACSIANTVDKSVKRYESRESEYARCIKRLGGVEKPAQLLAILTEALEKNPDQDFLGALYMGLELGNQLLGQCFTPYPISRLLAELTLDNCQKQIEKDGWISVGDPTVGGGSMLIAGANTMRRQMVNYQTHVIFAGQDIDRIVAMMAYIQISLLGCPGYIVVGDSMLNPIVGSSLEPIEKEGQEFWYTPFYFSQVWCYRRIFTKLDKFFMKEQTNHFSLRGGFLFEFEEGGSDIVA